MRVLVTGADGFVGRWLVPALVAEGHAVTAALGPDEPANPPAGAAAVLRLDLGNWDSLRTALAGGPQAVIHLAAMASSGDARRDPGRAWEVNAAGTARLAEELGRQRAAADGGPLLLLASTIEVYGQGRGAERLRIETDAPEPCSPYAASKLGAEVAALEVHRRVGLRVVIARAAGHTGRGQDERFVVPAFARRLVAAKRVRAPAVNVGNLDPVREFLHVSDVARAYIALLAGGEPGEIYNVAAGQGITLRELFRRLAQRVGHEAIPEVDAALMRAGDVPHLVGDGAKLRRRTGWAPRVSLDETLAEVVDAQAD